MSSVASWISKSQISLKRVRDCFQNMGETLPKNLHYGPFGSQFTVFFEVNRAFNKDYFISKKVSSKYKPIIKFYDFADRKFAEFSIQIAKSEEFVVLFDRFGLSDLSTRYLLAEQTTADIEIDMEPGFAVVGDVAFAACGGITWVVKDSSIKEKIEKIADRYGVERTDVNMLAAWFDYILKREKEKDRYKRLLESTPTSLFSILFDGSDGDIRIVGLRQNERENGYVSEYEHLFYTKDKGLIMMARTESGLNALRRGLSDKKVILVKNREPVSFSVSEL